MVADAADDGDAIRRPARRMRGCIQPNPTRKSKRRYDRRRYQNGIERFFGRVKRDRRVATRYDKTAANFAGFVWLAAVLETLMLC